MRKARALAIAVAFSLFGSTPTFAADESFGDMIKDAAIKGAGSKGGEFAVKFVAGWIYNLSCKPEQQTDEGSKALCSALGSVSGKSDEEWKKKIEGKLEDISNKLGVLESGQKQILEAIRTQHREMDNQFKQVGANVRVTAILTTIDNFWGRFKSDVNPKVNTSKVDLEKFAREVMNANLHRELGELNSLLSHPIDNSQPLLRFPFYQYRQKLSQQAPGEAFSGMTTYDYAEKKFAYYRAEQQKGYLIYLWAAEIIQGACEIEGDAKCNALPITATAFAREFERFTRDQLETFDSAANGMLLAYSRPDSDIPNFLLRNPQTLRILARINYLTATTLGSGQGAWVEVIAADGDPWKQEITLEWCGGGNHKLKPLFSYTVPADTLYGPTIDWWTSRANNGTYDEVHFSSNWRIYHYAYEEAPVSNACRVLPEVPDYSDRFPFTPSNGAVESVTRDGATFPFGVLYALKRAGGTYALASGQNWSVPGQPTTADSGDATKQETRFDWVISPAHHEGLWVSMLNSARVDHTVGKSIINNNQEAKVKNSIYAYNKKSIYFPEGGKVKLRMLQHNGCEKVCTNGSSAEQGIMDYDIEHSPYEAGKMTAVVAAFFDPNEGENDLFNRAKNGIYIDGSYGNTSDRKQKRVESTAEGEVKVTAGTAYHLQYLLSFDLVTHSKRVDSTRYRFMGKLTPSLMFITK